MVIISKYIHSSNTFCTLDSVICQLYFNGARKNILIIFLEKKVICNFKGDCKELAGWTYRKGRKAGMSREGDKTAETGRCELGRARTFASSCRQWQSQEFLRREEIWSCFQFCIPMVPPKVKVKPVYDGQGTIVMLQIFYDVLKETRG